ncbi:MAG: type IV secretory system conjugative DNA transfer family protein, partial [Acidimicrobiia bacterium]
MATQRADPGSGFETAIVAAGAAIIGVGFATWLGARLAVTFTGGSVHGGLGDWLDITIALASGTSPVSAWGDRASGLPGAPVYWTCTSVAVLVLVAVGVGLWWIWRRVASGETRTRFGQPTDAHQARPRDVAPLVVSTVVPPAGRMLLGRMNGHGPLLATEDRQRHPLTGRAALRQGNRGSVALIGPTGSGKTALATSAIATWDGPVVAVSVKRDLYDTTVAARTSKGDVAVFDPGGVTGLPTARWSPLEATVTSSGALRTGRALAQAIPKGGVTNAEYWAEHGEGLLGAFMCVAGLSRLLPAADDRPPKPIGMEQLAAWVRTLAGGSDPTINRIITRACDNRDNIEIQLLGRHAATTFTGVAREDDKIRSSVYSTAVLALKPWLEPAVAHSASTSPHAFYSGGTTFTHRPRYIDLDWLMSGEPGRANTLYLSAPTAEFERLSPVLGGVLADLKDTIHAWDIANRKLDKPLLIVIDEAAHLQLGWLPTEVSTIAALGAFFVTCWQNLAQINHRYDSLADAVLSGHRTKCFFAGIDDLTTLKYLTTMLGHEEVVRRGWSHDVPTMWATRQAGRRSVSESTQRQEFAPAHTLREMIPGEAVLFHGTLPPIHLTAVRHWEEPELVELVRRGTDAVATCPLSADLVPEGDHPAIDIATLEAAKAQLPKALPEPAAAQADPTRLPNDTEKVVCTACHDELAPGEWKQRPDGTRQCAPNCHERRTQ